MDILHTLVNPLSFASADHWRSPPGAETYTDYETLTTNLSIYPSILHSSKMVRREPNIIITGTPGVGKSSHCEPLAQSTGLKHLGVNQIIKEKGCHEGWSEQFGSFIVDDEKVRNYHHW